MTTISEQSQLLSPSKLLALQRQSTLSVSQPRLTTSSIAGGIASPVLCGSSVESDLGIQQRQATSSQTNTGLPSQQPVANCNLIPGVSVGLIFTFASVLMHCIMFESLFFSTYTFQF